MANTEGWSDEATAQLTMSQGGPVSITGGKTGNGDRSRQRDALRRRMEMPIGETPAASVVRRSTPRAHSDDSHPVLKQQSLSTTKDEQRHQKDEQVSVSDPSLVGGIMERKCSRRKKKSAIITGTKSVTRNDKNKSRFLRDRQLKGSSTGTGFPTLDVPLGTFTKPGTKVKHPPKRDNAESLRSPVPSTTGINPDSLQSISRVASQDAQNILDNMTSGEVDQSVQELKDALSPEMIAFLRQRGQAKKSTSRRQPGTEESQSIEPNANVEPEEGDEESNLAVDSRNVGDERSEKERLAERLSSIRTYEELDDAYRTEMGENASSKGPLPNTVGSDAEKDDFILAAELLRSSSQRQRLWAARTISHRLRDDVIKLRQSTENKSPLFEHAHTTLPSPELLPVSLRCLLDAPPSSNGYVLHTYVLQSIYYLLQLLTCPEFSVDVETYPSSEQGIFQLYYMDDNIPTPSLAKVYTATSVAPVATPQNDIKSAAYATSSSSKSAQSDGTLFMKDPAWTLLSRMRIIPRLAQLLDTGGRFFPPEGIKAICGILSMVGNRSPGAASAIVQHKTLLQDLIDRTAGTGDSSTKVDPEGTLSAIYMMCSLARQSRVAAEGLPVDLIMFRTLSKAPTDTTDFHLQQWTIILWRTVLRYGLFLSQLQFTLSVAAPHFVLGDSEFQLGAEFLNAFRNVARCIRVAKRGVGEKIPTGESESLAIAGAWFSGTTRESLKLISGQGSLVFPTTCNRDLNHLRLYASSFRFLESMILIIQEETTDANGEFKIDDLSRDEDIIINALANTAKSETFGQLAASVIQRSFDGSNDDSCLAEEAASCGYLESFVSLIMTLQDNRPDAMLISSALVTVMTKVLTASIKQYCDITDLREDPGWTPLLTRPRPWTNRVLTTVATFLARSTKGTIPAQPIVMLTLGRLQVGDEGAAAVLLSHDHLFQTSKTVSSAESQSPISTMLVRELCRSHDARSQLDHSFKLRGGYGISSSGGGPYALESLLSEIPRRAKENKENDSLLPLGPLWIWQVLSGSVVDDRNSTGDTTGSYIDVASIILSCLSLIKEIEESKDPIMMSLFKHINSGGKLYHLTNVCLQPETILKNERIQASVGDLVDLYTTSSDDWIPGFASSCYIHTSSKLPSSQLKPPAPKDVCHALDEFVNDLCDAFTEYGAQYPFFAKCLRIFLLPGFPSKIRCGVVKKTSALQHLFTLPEDDIDMTSLLKRYLRPGASLVDGSSPGDPAFLDSLCHVVSDATSEARSNNGLVSYVATALLAKNLTENQSHNRPLATSARNRLNRCSKERKEWVLRCAALFLSTERTIDDLARVTLESLASNPSISIPTILTADLETK